MKLVIHSRMWRSGWHDRIVEFISRAEMRRVSDLWLAVQGRIAAAAWPCTF